MADKLVPTFLTMVDLKHYMRICGLVLPTEVHAAIHRLCLCFRKIIWVRETIIKACLLGLPQSAEYFDFFDSSDCKNYYFDF